MTIIATIIYVAVFSVSALAQAADPSIDWANFSYSISGKTVKIVKSVETGTCAEIDADGVAHGYVWSISDGDVRYGDVDGDGKQEAVVTLRKKVCDVDRLSDESIAVLNVGDGKVKQMPPFDFTDEGCDRPEDGCDYWRARVSVEFEDATRMIVVTTYFQTVIDADCCPSLERRKWYKWSGSGFSEVKKSGITAIGQKESK